MSQQKELAYGTAISITAEQAIKYYLEMAKEKEEKEPFFALFLSITSEEFRTEKFKRPVEGKEEDFQVESVLHKAIQAISGCDKELRIVFQEQLKRYRRAIIKCHEPTEIEDIKLDLKDSFDDCLGNDLKIDQDNLREQVSIFFNFIDLFKIKKNLDITNRVDEAVKKLTEKMDAPRTEAKKVEKRKESK
jgi:hypothetical protein